MNGLCSLVLAGLAIAAAPSAGDEKGGASQIVDATIDEFNLGTHWFGPRIDLRDLAGKVVLVETWGS